LPKLRADSNSLGFREKPAELFQCAKSRNDMVEDEAKVKLELEEFLHREPSFLGRWIGVAGLWNHATGRYDLNLPERFRDTALDRALGKWHASFFQEWLALPLEKKEADLIAYWENLGRPIEHINRIRAIGEAAIPPLTSPAQRQDSIHDLILIAALLRYKATNK